MTGASRAEIVTISAGGAGMAAAVAAFEKGARSAALLEKMGSPGGSTAMAHDIFAVENPIQKCAWVQTSRDAALMLTPATWSWSSGA